MNVLDTLKKGIALFSLSALALVAGSASVSAAANLGFTDDAQIPSWAEEAIEELMFQGVISGNADGSFAPARQLNRAEVAKIIVLATGVSCTTPTTATFPDVQPGDWFFDYVECMVDYGWIDGYPDGMFRPAVGINRAEIAKMVVNAFDIDQDMSGAPHFTDVSSSDWFYSYVETAYNAGVMQGYTATTFSPASAVTRAETARIVYDAQLFVYNDWQPEFSEGALEVALSADTPAGTNIPFNATSVPYTTVEFSASADSDVEIGRVTYTRLGLGDNDSFDKCWMEFDGFKVGNDKSVTNDDLVELTFNPPIVVPAGQTLVGDLVCSSEYDNTGNTQNAGSLDDRNIGQRNRFAIIGAEDILSTAVNVIGDFPLEGEEMETADYAVSTIEFTDLGSNSTVEVGDEFAEIGKFRMLNDSANSKDVELRAITFENDGEGELAEMLFDTALYISGDQVSYETIIDGDYVTFRLDDGINGGYILEDGDSRVFSIRTDIVSAENGDFIQFKVDNYEDIVAIEIGTSFGVRTLDEDGNDAEDEDATLATYTVDSGDLNISRDNSNPGNEEYAPGSNEVVAQVIRAVVGQPMEFDGIQFEVVTGSTVTSKDGNTTNDELADFNETFDNFRLYIDDQLLDTEQDITMSNGVMVLDFDTSFELSGTSIMRLVLNVEDDAVTGDQIKFQVAATDFDGPEYISSGDSVPATELLGTATGSFIQVELSELIITKTDGFTSGDSIVAGEDDVNVLEFTLTNNNAGDVNVTSVQIGGFGSGAGAVCQNYTLALFMDGVQRGSSRNMEANCLATFNDLNGIVIPSGEQKEFTLVVNTLEVSATGTTTASFTVSPLSGLGIAKDINPTNGTNNNPYAACVYIPTASAVPAVGETITFEDANREVRFILEAVDATAAPTGTFASTNTYDCSGVTAQAGMTVYAIEGGTTVTATAATPWNQTHIMGTSTVSIGYTYPAATTATTYVVYVNDASGFTAGQEVNVPGVNDDNGTNVCIAAGGVDAASTPNQLTLQECTPGTLTVLAGALTTGTTVTLVGSSATIAFGVTAIEADNVENGQSVNTIEANEVLTSLVAEGTDDDNCDNVTGGASASNYLCGVDFNLISGGELTVTSGGTTIFSDILIADETDVEVMQIRFNAAFDEIQITDLYLENDVYVGATVPFVPVTTFGANTEQSDGSAAGAQASEVANNSALDYSLISERVDFKLYNSAGVLLDQRQMQADGSLHFNLGNSNRIVVPKDDSETVSVKVNIRDINAAGETGMRLRLSLDGNNAYNGIEAITAATGDDITMNTVLPFWEVVDGIVTSEDFVAYRTEFAVKHASAQVQTIQPSANSQEIYRFTVEADSAHEVYVGRLTFDMSTNGFYSGAAGAPALPAPADFVVYQVNGSGTPDTSNPIAVGTGGTLTAAGTIDVTEFGSARTAVAAPAAAATGDQFRLTVDFDTVNGGEILNAGTSKTYAIFMANTGNDTAITTNSAIDDYVTATIVQDLIYAAPADYATQGGVNGAAVMETIVWSDAAAPSHSPATADWLNGYLLDVDTNALPVGEY